MRWHGKIQELAQLIFRKSGFAVTVEPVSASADTTYQLPAAGGGTKALVSADASQALTNKTIVVSSNTVTTAASGNLAATELNAALSELQSDIDTRATSSSLTTHESASTAVHGVTGSVVGTSDSQNLTNKNLASSTNTLTGATAASFSNSGTVSLPSGTRTLVARDTTDILTNKDIDGGTASSSNRITLPKGTKTALDALGRKEATLVYATDTKTVYVDDATTLNELGGAGVSTLITQASHGFTASDKGAPLYLNGSTYTKAKADAANTAEVVGVIGDVLSVNQFKLINARTVSVDTSVSGGALVAGTVYFLSPSAAGQITATEPSVIGHVSMPLGVAKDTSSLILNIMRGAVVGGSNARTTVSLTNNATSTVQNVSVVS